MSVPDTAGLERDKYGSATRRRLIARYARALQVCLDELAPASVLDAGTGTGDLWTLMPGPLPPLAGVDCDRTCLRASRLPGGRLACADAVHLPFPSRSIDLVFAVEVLEHSARPDALLAELVRVARRHVLVGVPQEPWFRLGCLAALRYLPTLGNSPNHLQQFTAGTFAALLARHGQVIRRQRSFPWQFGVIAVPPVPDGTRAPA